MIVITMRFYNSDVLSEFFLYLVCWMALGKKELSKVFAGILCVPLFWGVKNDEKRLWSVLV